VTKYITDLQSADRKKNNVEIPQGRPDMTAEVLFTDGITCQQYSNTLNSVTLSTHL